MKEGYVVINNWGRVKKLEPNKNPKGCRAGVLFNPHYNEPGTIFSTRGKAKSAVKRTKLYAAERGQADNEFWMDMNIQKVKTEQNND